MRIQEVFFSCATIRVHFKNAGFFIFKDILMMWYNMDVGNLKLKGMEYDEREERDYEKTIF